MQRNGIGALMDKDFDDFLESLDAEDLGSMVPFVIEILRRYHAWLSS